MHASIFFTEPAPGSSMRLDGDADRNPPIGIATRPRKAASRTKGTENERPHANKIDFCESYTLYIIHYVYTILYAHSSHMQSGCSVK